MNWGKARTVGEKYKTSKTRMFSITQDFSKILFMIKSNRVLFNGTVV
jgi:hypothetical protein